MLPWSYQKKDKTWKPFAFSPKNEKNDAPFLKNEK